MADSTLDSELFVLIDNWPGVARRVHPDHLPNDDIISALHHNVTSPVFDLGEKIVVRNRSAIAGDDGDSTFIYLKFLAVTAANPTPAVKQLVVPVAAAEPFRVTNDPDQCLMATGCPLAAVLLSAMSFDQTTAYYGFAWCGGVCPEAMVAALGGNYLTDDAVDPGPIIAADLDADSIGLGLVTGDTTAAIGHSYSADA